MRRIAYALLLIGAEAAASGPAVSKDGIQSELTSFISQSHPSRSVGTPGHDAACEFIKKEFQKIAEANGGKVYEHTFLPDVDYAVANYQNDFSSKIEGKVPPTDPEYAKWKKFTNDAVAFVRKYRGRKGHNLILELKGATKPAEVVYVGAHYDTITHDHATLRFTPEQPTDGADDNASAVAALLAVARAVAAQPRDRTVRFVAFDYEEIFFLGSYALAKELKAGKLPWADLKDHFLGLYNLEMLGWSATPISRKPVFKLYARTQQEDGAASDMALAKMFKDSVQRSGLSLRAEILQNGFDRGDNWSFWQLGFPAVCVSQDWEGDFDEANYHTSHDSLKNLNLDYLTEISRAVVATLQIALKGGK